MPDIITSVLPILAGGEQYNVTSPFGWRRDPIKGEGNQQHKGIDMTLWRGWSAVAPVCAAWDGTVTAVRDEIEGYDESRSAGNYVIVDHGDGLSTRYYHLAYGSVRVAAGDTVAAGQELGFMGATGAVTGAHLHFQLEMDGVPIDPEPFLVGEVPETLPEAPSGGGEDGTDGEGMDNTPADWAAEAVAWAQESGILYGDENGNLRLHEPCTREMVLVFLYRTLGGGQ